MANLQDYVRWRGDLTLAERPWNVVDALVLTALSNVDLTGVVPAPGAPGVTVAAAADRLDVIVENSRTVRRMVFVPPDLVADLGASARFRDAVLSDYVDLTDVGSGVQFSAVTVRLPNGTAFVSFRGTDTSIVGWREDFAMSFEVMPSQPLATAYLRDRIRESTGPVVVGGHSKGGNLAVYAAVTQAEADQRRISAVYDCDGPGMSPEVADDDALRAISGRVTKIVPGFTVIGRLFDHAPPAHVVASTARGMLQHDIMTWQVEGTGLVELDQVAPESEVLSRAIDDLLEESSLADRRSFTDAFFSALAAGGATLMVDVPRSGFGSIESVLFSLIRSRDKTRNTVRLGLRAGWRALSSIDLGQLVRQRAAVRGAALLGTGIFLLIVPSLALQILGTFAIVALATVLTARGVRYVSRFRHAHRLTWPWIVGPPLVMAALITGLFLVRSWIAPTNLLLGVAFLLGGYAAARRGLAMLYRRPQRTVRGTLLLAGTVVAFGFAVVALSTAGQVEPWFVVRAGTFLTVAGVVELFFVTHDRARRTYVQEVAVGHLGTMHSTHR